MTMMTETKSQTSSKKSWGNEIIERSLSSIPTSAQSAVDLEARTIDLSFSSENPCLDSTPYGNITHILDHSPGAVRLERLNRGGPVLIEHNVHRQIGVVLHAFISSDRMGRAKIKLNDSEESDKLLKDAKAGIRTNVSINLQPYKKVKEVLPDGSTIIRVLEWEPGEISIVAIPVDFHAGIGRSYHLSNTFTETFNMTQENTNAKASTESEELTEIKRSLDIQTLQSQARKEEMERIRGITHLGDKFKQRTLMNKFIENGDSTDNFNRALLEVIDLKTPSLPIEKPATQIGLSSIEAKKYNLSRAITALADGNPDDAGFEFECSQEVARARGKGVEPGSLHIPFEVQFMAQMTRSAEGQYIKYPEKGGILAPADFHLEKFIDMLREDDVLSQLGVTILPGLQHGIDIPKQSAAANGHWLGEAEPAGLTSLEVNYISLRPKTYATGMLYTRQMRLQAGAHYMDYILKRELATVSNLAKSKAVLFGAGPEFRQPKGVLTHEEVLARKLTFSTEKPTYDDVVELETMIDADNALMGTLGYLGNARMAGLLKRSEISSGTAQYLLSGGQVNGYKFMKSNQMPDNCLVYGNFADVLLGVWATMEIKADTASRANRDDTILRVFLDVDTAIRHPESFSMLVKESSNPIQNEINLEKEKETKRKARTAKQMRDEILEQLGPDGIKEILEDSLKQTKKKSVEVKSKEKSKEKSKVEL